jgi:hypothetical protein
MAKARRWQGMASEGDFAHAPEKIRFHKAAHKALKVIAEEMLLLRSPQYGISTNGGGVGVEGETMLHTDHIYAQVLWDGRNMDPHTSRVMWRTCKGRKDYSGGQNHWGDLRAFTNWCHGWKSGPVVA